MSRRASANLHRSYREVAKDFRDNPGQFEAYESTGNCVILAGPGSGKTKILTTKLARMLAEDVRPPHGIACITYSLECAGELQRRLAALGVEEARNVFIGTVHSFCFKNIILPYGHLSDLQLLSEPSIATDEQRRDLFESALKAAVSADEQPWRWRTRFECYRRNFPDQDGAEFRENDGDVANVVLHYEAALRERNLIDFDGMVLNGLRLIERHEWVRRAIRARFPILAVDEYQDLGLPLHRIVTSLCFHAEVRLLAVGDPDQSIYGSFGAKPELLQALARIEGVQAVRLPFNYRCGQTIVAMSETVLGQARGYQSKTEQAGTIDFYERPEGLAQQAKMICDELIPEVLERKLNRRLGDIAVLYLDKNDGEVIAEAVAAAELKYVRIDKGAPYRRTPLTRWIEECAEWCSGGWEKGLPRLSLLIRAWLRLDRSLRSSSDRRARRLELVRFLFSHRDAQLHLSDWLDDLFETSLTRTLQVEPALADQQVALAELSVACRDAGKLDGITLGAFSGQTGSPQHLNLITLHSAKGLEFDAVIMMGMDQGRIPSWSETTPAAKQQSRRLFYVGLTRARHEVHLTYSGWTENKYGQRYLNGPSEFLLEVKRKLAEI
jgi:DNA helicase II / ATP-dependent DNA helicase PcrA